MSDHPSAPPADPTTTRYAAAFALWEQRYRDQPADFLTADEVARMAVADVSERCAIYFTALLREVDGQAIPPDTQATSAGQSGAGDAYPATLAEGGVA